MNPQAVIEKNIVLVRKYKTTEDKLVTYPQCKVFFYDGQYIAFRDIYPNKSQLFRDKTWNMDHVVFDWLRIHGIKDVYYYDCKRKRLFKTTIKKIENGLKREEVYKEKLNNHTQYFVPNYLFSIVINDDLLITSRKWIKSEIDVSWMSNTFDKLEKREPDIYINPDARRKLAEIWRSKFG